MQETKYISASVVEVVKKKEKTSNLRDDLRLNLGSNSCLRNCFKLQLTAKRKLNILKFIA